jgi:hypothetical protein
MRRVQPQACRTRCPGRSGRGCFGGCPARVLRSQQVHQAVPAARSSNGYRRWRRSSDSAVEQAQASAAPSDPGVVHRPSKKVSRQADVAAIAAGGERPARRAPSCAASRTASGSCEPTTCIRLLPSGTLQIQRAVCAGGPAWPAPGTFDRGPDEALTRQCGQRSGGLGWSVHRSSGHRLTGWPEAVQACGRTRARACAKAASACQWIRAVTTASVMQRHVPEQRWRRAAAAVNGCSTGR